MELRRSTYLSLSVLCLSLVASVSSVNILVIDAVISPSHQIWMRELSYGLGNQGYNVTVLSATAAKNTPKNVHYLGMPELWEWLEADMADISFLDMGSLNIFGKIAAFVPMYWTQDQIVLNSTAFKTLTSYPKDFKFDLMIYDYLSAYALVSLKEHFNNPPLVAVSPYPGVGMTNVMTKGPDYFSFVPHMIMDEVEDSFWGRLESFLVTSLYHALEEYYILPGATKAVRQVLPDQVQTIQEMLLSSKIQMANYHPAIDQVQPILPSVIPVGGLQIAEPKPLPEDLEKIYSQKSKGNIIFSLGTNVQSQDLGLERLQGIIGALREFPEYNFIWKIDLKNLDLELPKNVYIKGWLPQNDLLADNRTVLFMSHAGGLSTQECTWFGVPMLALPVMFDQFPNSERVVKSGMGLKVDIKEITKEKLQKTLQELLTNDKYRETAQLMSRNFRDQPEKPLERALWWIDYVLRNPDVEFLQNKKMKGMSYVAKHSIDVIAFLTVVALVLGCLIVKVIVWVVRKSQGGKRKVKVQ